MSRTSSAIRRSARAPRLRRFVTIRRRVKPWFRSRTIWILYILFESLTMVEYHFNLAFPESHKTTALILGLIIGHLSLFLRLTTNMPVALRKPPVKTESQP